MRTLKENEDKDLKDEFHELKLIATNHDSEKSFYNEKLIFHRPDNESYPVPFQKLVEFVENQVPETLYALLYESDQESQSKPVFKDKYDERSVEIEPDEIKEVENDLDEIHLLPADFGWLIKIDKEDNIRFYGDKEFIDHVKEFFPNWKKLSRNQKQTAVSQRERS